MNAIAESVPIGMLRPGLFNSPDIFAPAIIPIGRIIDSARYIHRLYFPSQLTGDTGKQHTKHHGKCNISATRRVIFTIMLEKILIQCCRYIRQTGVRAIHMKRGILHQSIFVWNRNLQLMATLKTARSLKVTKNTSNVP